MLDDLISRQALMKEFSDFVRASNDSAFARTPTWNDAVSLVGSMPPAQPELRCKECKWYELPSHKITENCVRWMKSNGILLPIKPNDYCSYAERRTDG